MMTSTESTNHYQLPDRTDAIRNDGTNPVATEALPATDTSREARLILFSAFLIELILWSFPFSFGVLQAYYRSHPPISQRPSGVVSVGVICSGVMYLGGAFVMPLCNSSVWLRRWSCYMGLILVVCGLLASSFAEMVWQLILSQGILYAVGGCFLYYPILVYIDEWFVRRKSMAYGIMWAGTGVGGLTAPLVLEWGLRNYGARTFLQGWAVMMVIIVGPALLFVKPRVLRSRHISGGRPRVPTAGWAFFRMRMFWALSAGISTQGLGYFLPLLYLPDYAQKLGLTEVQQSALVSVLNVASIPGLIVLSMLTDRLHVTTVVAISAAGSALSVLLFWGLSSETSGLPMLVVFSLLYGFFAGGFPATFTGMVKEIRGLVPNSAVDAGNIFAAVSIARGIGNIVSGPTSSALLLSLGGGKEGVGYSSSYRFLIIFTGVTMSLTMTPWVLRQLHLL